MSFSAEPIKATLLLCDSAQAVQNKLYILGGGWAFAGPDPISGALAILIRVPWHMANESLRFHVRLEDEDGQAARVGSSNEGIELGGKLEVGRPPGHPQGMPFNVPVAVNFEKLPLPAGGRFSFVFSVDGHDEATERVSFMVRPR